MNFIRLVNYIFSIVVNPQKYWNFNNKKVNFEKKSFLILMLFTIVFLSLIYLIQSFITLEYVTSSKKILNIFFNTLKDIIYFMLLFFTTKFLLNYFKIQRVSNKNIFILLYCTLIPGIISIIILKLFIGAFFLAIIFFYGYFVLFWGLKNFFEIDKNFSKIFSLLIISSVGYYAILYTLIRVLMG